MLKTKSNQAKPTSKSSGEKGSLSSLLIRCCWKSILLILVIAAVLNLIRVHHQHESQSWDKTSATTVGVNTIRNDFRLPSSAVKQVSRDEQSEPALHEVAGLSCKEYDGPTDEIATEMVYWRDIPSDAKFVSPFVNAGPKDKYLTFEPDEGGWNNLRMSMETAVAMAYVMGRILVLPPVQAIYLLGKNERGQKNHFSFSDFFHFESFSREHAGIDVISFEEFLKREGMKGNLRDKQTGQVSFPPDNQTLWDGTQNRILRKTLHPWIRSISENPVWDFNKCVAAFPSKPGANGVKRLNETLASLSLNLPPQSKRLASYDNKPTPVNASTELRLREMMAHRTNLCIYDEQKQNAKVFHLMGDNKSGARMLVHFYAFLFLEDWRHDLWLKRFVRDHLRYVDEIQCAAARVVNAIRVKSRQHGNSGSFDTFHIRRGDFQYKDTRVEPEVIFSNTLDILPRNSTIYIATDERNETFFDIFKEHYQVYFLKDFQHLLKDVNTNYYGMLDQRIASRGRTFVGTYYSTFTGYINRMRGYHAQIDKDEGHETGKINSFYYVPLRYKYAPRYYQSLAPPLWAREFPVGWRDLDHSLDDAEA